MAHVTVRVLGCGDAFGSGGRMQACFLLEAGRDRVLIDCGATSMVAMRQQGIDPDLVNTVLLSHLHGDHFGGLPFFLMAAQFVSARTRPLELAGPPGMRDRLFATMEVLFPGSSKIAWRFPLEIAELAAGRTDRFGEVTVLPYLVKHPSGAPPFALRLTCKDQVIAYSGDTEWTEALLKVAQGADLFIVECFAYAPKSKSHLDFQTLCARRPDLGAKRMVLTHMSQDTLARIDRQDLARLDMEAAHDGMVIKLPDAARSGADAPARRGRSRSGSGGAQAKRQSLAARPGTARPSAPPRPGSGSL
jgi:ribonuclease BN (tRNA processing enzyme)